MCVSGRADQHVATEASLVEACEIPRKAVLEKKSMPRQTSHLFTFPWGDSGTVVEKSFSNQKVASSIPCRSVLEQDTEPLIAPDVQCAISVNVKCVYIVSRT